MRGFWYDRRVYAAALVAGLVLLVLVSSCKASAAEEFRFRLLLDSPERSIVKLTSIPWADYDEQRRLGWPRGGLLYVSSPGCTACRELEHGKDGKPGVFEDPDVIETAARFVVCKTRPEDWRAFEPKGVPQLPTPFLVAISPGTPQRPGKMSKWTTCPLTVEGFLKIFPREKDR